MAGKFFDEWILNEEFVTPGRTITEADVVMYAGLSGDYADLHTNKELMKDSQFGERIAHGLLVMAISHGLVFRLGLIEGGAEIAFLSIESWQFKVPVFFGDTIHVKVKVAEKIPSKSKPDRGVLKLFLQIINQHGVVVQEGIRTLMMRKKV